jgi:hypothetical protein
MDIVVKTESKPIIKKHNNIIIPKNRTVLIRPKNKSKIN